MGRPKGLGVVARKSRRVFAVSRRLAARMVDSPSGSAPAVLANSMPKSGTHLLLQILGALPGARAWGLFIASQPSFTFRHVAEDKLARKIRAMANGEVAGAHVHWSNSISDAIAQRGAAHFLIYRDPRDVVVSEAYYLAEMNRWHRLHRYFRTLPDLQSRIRLSITGLDASYGVDYPDIAARYERFLGWLEHDEVCAIRYEELAGPGQAEAVRRIASHWLQRQSDSYSMDDLVERALDAIRPEKSHTFRRGQSGGWRDVMDAETRSCFMQRAEPLVDRLGYTPTELT